MKSRYLVTQDYNTGFTISANGNKRQWWSGNIPPPNSPRQNSIRWTRSVAEQAFDCKRQSSNDEPVNVHA